MTSVLSKTVRMAPLLVVAIVGCGQVNLYTNVPEKEANEMMAILHEHKIACSKKSGDDGSWNVTVDKSGFADAVEILSELGRPREKYVTMAELFPQKGLVSSPAEQRIRLTYGREQSLAETIGELPNVVSSRVHLVWPDTTALGQSLQPSSASVVVIHHPNVDMEASVLLIKQIVIGGVPELKADAISVELVPAEDSIFGPRGAGRYKYDNAGPQLATILSIQVAQDSVRKFQAILAASAGTFVLGIGLFVASLRQRRQLIRHAA